VLLKSNVEDPFVAEISEFYVYRGRKMFRAVWFYRPKDIKRQNEDNVLQFSKNELIYSDHIDSHKLETIISRCNILPRHVCDAAFDNEMYENFRTLFVCRYVYKTFSGIFI
jgi:hypothetical protein